MPLLIMLIIAISGLVYTLKIVDETENSPKSAEERLLDGTLTGNIEDEISAYREYLSKKPDNPGAWYQLGQALRQNGSETEANNAFKKAHSINKIFPLSGRDEDSIELMDQQWEGFQEMMQAAEEARIYRGRQ